MSRRTGTLAASAVAVVLFALTSSAAQAQYFGRQKVQYEDFDWKVMHTDHFKVHFYPEEEEVTRDGASMSERWYTRLSFAFQHEFDDKSLIYYADHPDFQQSNVIQSSLSEGTGGVTESLKTRVIMPWTGVYRQNDHVVGHELVHVFQYDIASSGPGGIMGLNRLPLWLVEGMAEYLSLGRVDANTAMWLRDAALRGELPTIDQLGRDPRFFPYRYGQALWAYIAGRWGDRAVTELFRFAVRSDWDTAVERVLGVTTDQISQDWTEAIRLHYLPLIQGRQRPEDAGDPVLYDDELGAMNLAPVISPDGRFVAFFGRREIFTVDLYVADARTGEVVKKLTSPNRNAHFDALSWTENAGTWSPDGRKFAFAAFSKGDNTLAILDVETAKVETEVRVPSVGAVNSPSWSPDGRTIAFTGMINAMSDLFLYDVASGEARRITDDRYANMHPAWSPDGRTLAFSTDEGPDTDLSRLVFGDLNLATIDIATGEKRVLQIFDGVKHINPAYSPDGADIFFISDREGFSDIYRYNIATGDTYQVTHLATGVSGITAYSPAMSVARTGRMMFSVFQNSGQNIYGIDADRTRGTLVARGPTTENLAAVLPPAGALGTGMIAEYLDDPLRGLPVEAAFEVTEYRPSLGLDYIGPPSIGVGTSSFGTGVVGGVSGFFSDMLGNHQLGVVLQAQGELKDIGGQALYLNTADRLNWGASVGRLPYLYIQRTVQIDPGSGLRKVSDNRHRVFIDQANAMSRYPFSTTRRLEASAGYTRYSFDTESYFALFNAFGQQVTEVEREDLASRAPFNFIETSLAYVGDNSYFGFTSPIAGQRFRFEVSPTFGSLTYQTLLADYRRYLLMRPFTLAGRIVHFGRYGSESDGFDDATGQQILSPLNIGWQTFVRGYYDRSFEFEECQLGEEAESSDLPCPAFNRLYGTRIAVANFEFRIPLIGVSELGLINFPFLPTEISPFFDIGVAWTGESSPTFSFDPDSRERTPIMSTGVSARFNLLGYVILEAYYAYPFNRPVKGAHFGFQMAPGW